MRARSAADAVKDAQVPVSAICQAALEKAVRDVASMRGTEQAPQPEQAAVGGFARFTPRARKAISRAQRIARQAQGRYMAAVRRLSKGARAKIREIRSRSGVDCAMSCRSLR